MENVIEDKIVNELTEILKKEPLGEYIRNITIDYEDYEDEGSIYFESSVYYSVEILGFNEELVLQIYGTFKSDGTIEIEDLFFDNIYCKYFSYR